VWGWNWIGNIAREKFSYNIVSSPGEQKVVVILTEMVRLAL